LIFTVGVRLDRWLNYRALATTRSLTSSVFDVREFEERRESALSPRASVLFRATNNLSFVASAGRASAQFDDDQNQFGLRRYVALDALVSRRLNKRSEVFIAAENLTNTRVETGRTPVLTVGPPLLVRVGLRLRIGAE
jgi:outer membrane receptor protein involved in Fe transport